jgi:hypothetical protein
MSLKAPGLTALKIRNGNCSITVIPAQLLATDVLLDPSKPEFRSTRLKTASALRWHELAIRCSSLIRYLGAVDPLRTS